MPYAGREEGHRYFYRHSSFTPRSTFFLPFSFSYPLPFPRRSPSYSVSPSLHFTLVPSYPPAQPLFLHLFAPLAPTFSVTLSTFSRHLLSFLVRTLPREATTVSSFHLSPFQSFFSTTFWRYVEPHWRLNPYRWLLTEYHGFPRCWTIFATDFRSLVGKLSGGTRRKRERRERRYNKRYINIFIVNIFIVTLFYNRARTLYWVKVVLPDAHMRDGVTRWQN